MKLTPIAQRFILHWGDMGNSWGVNRTVAQIHALLFFHGRPLNAEEIADTLNAARSNVSNSQGIAELGPDPQQPPTRRPARLLRHLRRRRELLRTIVRERKQREFDPTSQMLRDLIAEPGFEEESPDTQDRVHETLRLMESLGIWTDEMLRLSPRRWTRCCAWAPACNASSVPGSRPRPPQAQTLSGYFCNQRNVRSSCVSWSAAARGSLAAISSTA